MQNETHQILVNKYCAECTVANITVGAHWGILINNNVVLYKNILNKTILGETNPKNLRKKLFLGKNDKRKNQTVIQTKVCRTTAKY